MTEEAGTTEFWLEPDYSEQLDKILFEVQGQNEFLSEIQRQEVEQTRLIASYMPQIYNVVTLALGAFIVLNIFRFLTSFLGRVFNDTTKF